MFCFGIVGYWRRLLIPPKFLFTNALAEFQSSPFPVRTNPKFPKLCQTLDKFFLVSKPIKFCSRSNFSVSKKNMTRRHYQNFVEFVFFSCPSSSRPTLVLTFMSLCWIQSLPAFQTKAPTSQI